MMYIFSSVFASEMQSYIRLISESGRCTLKTHGQLKSLDKHLLVNEWNEKVLTTQIISGWLSAKTIHINTKVQYISTINGFTKYLTSLGISAVYLESPKDISTYMPYIFSEDEINRIFLIADDFGNTNCPARISISFPVLLRILYGCGLRLSEGLSLRWKDIDLEQEIITVIKAKNMKQRFVPMSNSLSEILKDYFHMAKREKICGDYLFESCRNHGKPYDMSTFYRWFMTVLQKAGIEYAKTYKRERGPCPHCMRHTFTMLSFSKSDNEGKRFEDTAPFLAAYLGHDSPIGTETYISSNHTLYTRSHQRVNAAIGNLFPEVCFDEE